MRVTNYQRLSAAGPEPEGGARAGRGAARAWEALRRAAAGGGPAVRRAAALGGPEAVGRQEGGPAAAGEGGGGGEVRVRLGQLRAQLRRRGVDGRGGRVLARAVVRRVQARRCPVIHEESFPFIVALWGLATDYLLRLVICYILCRIDL